MIGKFKNAVSQVYEKEDLNIQEIVCKKKSVKTEKKVKQILELTK